MCGTRSPQPRAINSHSGLFYRVFSDRFIFVYMLLQCFIIWNHSLTKRGFINFIWGEGNSHIRRGCFFGILRVLQIISTWLHCLLPLNRALGYPLLRLRSKYSGGQPFNFWADVFLSWWKTHNQGACHGKSQKMISALGIRVPSNKE